MKFEKMYLIFIAISIACLFNVILDFNPSETYFPIVDQFITLDSLQIFKNNLLSGQNPLSNQQWFCGQYNPISDGLSPIWFLPTPILFLLFDLATFQKIIYLLAIAFSGIFFWMFSKNLAADSDAARLYGSVVYMLGGALIGLFYWGPLELILGYPLIPLAFILCIRAINSDKIFDIILAGISLSLFMYLGSVYFLSFLLMVLAFAVVFPLEGERDLKKFLPLGKILVALLIISAPRIMTLSYPDIRTGDVGGNDFGEMMDHLINRRQAWYQVRERQMYLGLIPIGLALFAIFSDNKKKYLFAFSALFFFIWIAGTNNIANFFPLKVILHHMFRDTRRALFFLPFLISALGVIGFKEAQHKLNWKNPLLLFLAFFIITEGLTSLIQPTGISSILNYESKFYFIPNFEDAARNFLPMIAILGLVYFAARQTKATLIQTALILLAVFHIITITLPIIRPYPDWTTDPDILSISAAIPKGSWVYVNADEYLSKVTHGLTLNGVNVANPPFQAAFKVTDQNLACGKYVVSLKELPDTILLATNLAQPKSYAAKVTKLSTHGKFILYSADQVGVVELTAQQVVWDLKYGSFLYEKA